MDCFFGSCAFQAQGLAPLPPAAPGANWAPPAAIIDEDSIFITGGSGGGILSRWCIGKTDRFRAAAPLYAAVNWYSEVFTCDIASMSVNHHFAGFPWDNVEHYLKYSPISLVGKVKTPTMIITGEQDFRTRHAPIRRVLHSLEAAEQRGGAGSIPRSQPRDYQSAKRASLQDAAHHLMFRPAQKDKKMISGDSQPDLCHLPFCSAGAHWRDRF